MMSRSSFEARLQRLEAKARPAGRHLVGVILPGETDEAAHAKLVAEYGEPGPDDEVVFIRYRIVDPVHRGPPDRPVMRRVQ